MNNVPWLRSGIGKTPAEGGCIMQVIDWIHRNEWTDEPPCVHPALRWLAINLNDKADDAGRQKLLDLAPRLMGTADVEKPVSVGLAVFCARRVFPIFEARYPNDERPRKAIEAAEKWLVTRDAATSASAYAAAYAADYAAADADAATYAAAAAYAADAATSASAYAAYAADAAAYAAAATDISGSFDLLLACLDEYDRLTGRTHTEQVDWAPVCEVMATT